MDKRCAVGLGLGKSAGDKEDHSALQFGRGSGDNGSIGQNERVT